LPIDTMVLSNQQVVPLFTTNLLPPSAGQKNYRKIISPSVMLQDITLKPVLRDTFRKVVSSKV